MLDIREHIANGLKAICDNTKMTKPSGAVNLPAYRYYEISNTSANLTFSGPVAEDQRYGVEAYGRTFAEAVELAEKADKLMIGTLGFRRTRKTSDADAFIATDMYCIKLEYTCRVNLIIDKIIRGLS